MCDSEIRVKQIRVNQGLGVLLIEKSVTKNKLVCLCALQLNKANMHVS